MREAEKHVTRDLRVASVLALVGAAMLLFALSRRWNPQEMNPGIEGTLTAVIAGVIFAVIEGVDFLVVLAAFVPIAGVTSAACLAVGGPALPVLGLEIIALAALGFGRAWLRGREVSAASRAEAEAEVQREAPQRLDVLVSDAE